jgi:protein-serine/threonine kinase
MKESNSLHLDEQSPTPDWKSHPGAQTPNSIGVESNDLFGAFSSVTLHYDGEI